MKKFKKGDEVFSTEYGFGIVLNISSFEVASYVVDCKFKNSKHVSYTIKGKRLYSLEYPSLFHTPQEAAKYFSNIKEEKKVLSFVDFLKENGVYNEYMFRVKIENQRWNRVKYYTGLEDIKKKCSEDWFDAFKWDAFNGEVESGHLTDSNWDKLDTLWNNLIEEYEVIQWDSVKC